MNRPNNRKFLVIAVLAIFLFAQKALASTDQSAPTESEVLVVYNSAYTTDSDSSGLQDSQQIAQYYKSKRPGVSIVGLAMPTTEEITWDQYNNEVKAPLENYLTTNNLVDTYKIIVTVKGVPLKIMGDVANNISKITAAGSSTIFASTGANPYSLAIDTSGNLYAANYYGNNVTKITPAGVSSTLGSTGSNPRGIIVDASGNVYTANYGSNNVTKITPAGGSSTLGSTGTQPYALVMDSQGNIYTANYGSANVTKITPEGTSSVFASVGAYSKSIAIDSSDNLYVPSTSANNVIKITSAGTTTTLASLGASAHPSGVVVDASGNVYTANYSTSTITKITPAGVATTFANTGFGPYAITIDSSGNLYTVNYTSENVTKVTSAGIATTLATTGPGPSGIVVDASGNVYTSNAHGHHDPWGPECGSYCYDMNYSAVDQGITLSFQNFKSVSRRNNPYYNVDPGFLKNSHFKLNYFTVGVFTLRYLVSRLDGYTVSDIETMIDHGVAADTSGSGYWVLDKDGLPYDRMATANTKLVNLGKNTAYYPAVTDPAHLPYNISGPVIGYTSYGRNGNPDLGDGYISDPANPNHLISNPNFTILPGAIFSTYESYNAYGFVAPTQSTHGQLAEWEQIGGSGGIGNIYEPWSSGIANESIWMPAYAIGYPWIEAAYMSIPYSGFVEIVLGDPLMTIADTVAPGAVSNFILTQTGGGTTSLTWTNPTDLDFIGTKIVRKTGSYPTNTSDGTVVYNGTATSFSDSGLSNGTTYYYAAFAYDATPNYSVINNDSKALVLADTVAPNAVSSLAVTPGDSSASLTWVNPNNIDLTGIKIVRKSGSYPANYSDGTLVYNGLGTSVTDSGLTNGATYYYGAFAYDTAGNYSSLSSGSRAIAIIDIIAPGSVSNLNAISSNMTASLTWTKPTDPDLVGVKILRKTGSYPATYSDGTLVYNGLLTSLIDSGLTNGTTYYYSAFAYDSVPNYSVLTEGSKNTATPNLPSGGGGGGGGGGSTIIYCTVVNYSDWASTCSGTKQYRTVLNSSPTNCTLTTEQQTAMERSCQIISEPVQQENTNNQNQNNNQNENKPLSILDSIISEAEKMLAGKFEDYYLTANGKNIDQAGQEKAGKKYVLIFNADKKLTLAEKDLILDFVFYGTPLSKSLGEGERAGVVNSYFKAYGKLPNSTSEWQDVLKIANGRWPTERNSAAEENAKKYFKKIYTRQPDLKNNIDENAIMVIAYGLLPAKRNLQSEKVALNTYKWLYRKSPQDALAWNIVRAIAYSGAKK